jgi:hypothetical protein
MNKFLKNNKYFLLGILVIIWVIAINEFPNGYVIAGGDTRQFIEASDNFITRFYDWYSIAILFYIFFAILDKVGIDNTLQLSFYLGIFILGSYLSFWIFTKIIFNKYSDLLRSAISIFYALNLYTLYIFTYTWGYSHYQSLYISIPILTGLLILLIKKGKFIYSIWFGLFIFISSSGFGNVAFALSFSIFIFILLLPLYVFNFFKFNRLTLINILGLIILSLLVNAYWLLPVIPKMSYGVHNIFYENSIELNWWLSHTSNPIIETLRFGQDSNWYFPNNYPYQSIIIFKNVFIFLTLLPAIIFLSGLLFINKFDNYQRKMFLAFFSVLLILIIFIARVRPPFEIINLYFYNIWGINTLRGYEKFAIYSPFILAVLTLMSLNFLGHINKRWKYILLIVIIITPLPFFIGKIQQNMSAQFYSYKIEDRNYKKAKISFLLKIPNEYYAIKNNINESKIKSNILVMPYNKTDEWYQYPKWKLYGSDPTQFIYNKNYIHGSSQFKGWNFLKDFNEDYNDNYNWIIYIAGLTNSEFIIFHKDANEQSVRSSEYKMRILESEGLIKNLEENNYFIFYKIPDDYFIPYITWQKENIEIQPNIRSINSNFDKIKSSTTDANFREINPKKYEVNFTNVNDYIIHAEKFDPLWKAYYITDSGKEIEIKEHELARGYANGWKINPEVSAEKIIIEYYPTRLMWRGIWISGITVLLLLIYLLKYYYDYTKRNF